jgi:hypothetical protein
VPDLPGFGLSDKPARALTAGQHAEVLAAWLDAAGLSTVNVLGNSFGCQIAVELAIRRPDLIASLILVGPTVDPAAPTAMGQVRRWASDVLREDPHQLPMILADVRDAGPRRVLRTLRHSVDHRIDRRLPLVAAPVLILRGEYDRIAPAEWAAQAASVTPDGRSADVPGAAHNAVTTAGTLVAERAAAFVADLALSPAGRRATRTSSSAPVDGPAASRSDEPTASRPDEATASRPDEATASRPDEATASRPDEATASRPDEATASRPDEPAAYRSDEPATERHMALEHGAPAARARRLAEEVLVDWDMTDRTSEVLLVTTELVQNVTQHTSDGGELRLRRRDDAVLIEVTDGDPELPRVQGPSPTAVGGRGMLIVAATARRWGARPARWAGRTGKVVWAEVTRRLPR